MRQVYLPLLTLFICSTLHAQDITVKQDSLKPEKDRSTEQQIDTLRSNHDETMPLRLLLLKPTGSMDLQFTPYQRHSVNINRERGNSLLPPIHWSGAASDLINSKSRTVTATMLPADNLLLYGSATLGLVETPYFGKANYYNLNAGAQYFVSPQFIFGASGSYYSDFGVLPIWSTGLDASYHVSPNLQIDGGLTFMQTAGNMFGLSQSALMIDLHGRYRLNDDWFLNAYGGTPLRQHSNRPAVPMMPVMNAPYYGGSVEHWFNSTTGVESGVIWMRDMFTGKMRLQPKLELLFKPGK